MCRFRVGPAAVVLCLVVAACGGGESASTRTLPPIDDPPGLAHVHGIGVNPADGAVFVAAHSGLYRIREGRARIVANRYQDTMAFTVAGPDHFLASGHPDLREDLPPLLGLLESRNAGKTWVKRSLLGKADFHALRVAHGRIWGYDSTSSQLMVTKDGRRWDKRSAQVMRDFVVSPKSGDVVFASSGETLSRSQDGGRSWRRADSPEKPWLLAWPRADELWLVTIAGLVYRSDDSGRTWDKRSELKMEPQAFAAAGDDLYASSHREVFVSKDQGASWSAVYSEES